VTHVLDVVLKVVEAQEALELKLIAAFGTVNVCVPNVICPFCT